METYRFEVSCALVKAEDPQLSMSQEHSLMSGSGSLSIPSYSDTLYNENDFGVVQSPHQESYMIGHHRSKSLMEPWDKSNIKPIAIFTSIQNVAESPDVTVTETTPSREEPPPIPSSSQKSAVPKMIQVDPYNEELFQFEDDGDDHDLEPLPLSAIKHRKMSKSQQFLSPCDNEDSEAEGEFTSSPPSKQLQKFRSDSNLHSTSNMSLVERVTSLNLTAKKGYKSSTPTPPRLLHENSEEQLSEGEGNFKSWLTKRAVKVSSREMNAMTPFSS